MKTGLSVQQNVVEEHSPELELVTAQVHNMVEQNVKGRLQKNDLAIVIHVQVKVFTRYCTIPWLILFDTKHTHIGGGDISHTENSTGRGLLPI